MMLHAASVCTFHHDQKQYLQVGAPDSCAPKSVVMPVIPRFQLAQTDEYVLVTIRVPHIRVSAAETHVEVNFVTNARIRVLCAALGCTISCMLIVLICSVFVQILVAGRWAWSKLLLQTLLAEAATATTSARRR
jgi:hypothetical protein